MCRAHARPVRTTVDSYLQGQSIPKLTDAQKGVNFSKRVVSDSAQGEDFTEGEDFAQSE